MATRFYLADQGTPAQSPSPSASWNLTTGFDRKLMLMKSQQSSIVTIAAVTTTVPITTTQEILQRQWISQPIPPQLFLGTLSCSVQCLESAATANVTASLIVRVISQDGGTVRGTLLSALNYAAEFANASTTTRTRAAVAVTTVATQPGDVIVAEFGGHAAGPTGAGTYSLRWGNSAAADNSAADGSSTDSNPWLEFSQDIWPSLPENYRGMKVGSGLSTGEKIR